MHAVRLSAFFLVSALCGCVNENCCSPPTPIAVQYTHKYGQTLSSQEWTQRGSSGSIATRLPTGVTRVETYDQGVLHGDTTETFPFHATIALRQTYERGQKVRETEYGTHGMPLHQQEWRGDEQIITSWYPDGAPMAVENYDQERLISSEYFSRQHELEAQVLEGRGIRLCRNHFGNLTAREEISGGEVVLRTELYEDGSPKIVTPFVHGVIHGLVASYTPTGQPEKTEQFHMGLHHGLVTTFLNGDRVREIPFAFGKKEGMEKLYQDGRTIIQTVAWKNDLLHGPCETLLPDAHKTEWFYRGQLVPKFTYDRSVSKERPRTS